MDNISLLSGVWMWMTLCDLDSNLQVLGWILAKFFTQAFGHKIVVDFVDGHNCLYRIIMFGFIIMFYLFILLHKNNIQYVFLTDQVTQ